MTHEAESATIWRALVKEFDKGNAPKKSGIGETGLPFHSMMKDFKIIWKAGVWLTT